MLLYIILLFQSKAPINNHFPWTLITQITEHANARTQSQRCL